MACDISRSVVSHELSISHAQAAAIAKQFTVLPALKEWLTAVGMLRILRPLNANGIEQLGDFRGLDKEDLATLDGAPPLAFRRMPIALAPHAIPSHRPSPMRRAAATHAMPSTNAPS